MLDFYKSHKASGYWRVVYGAPKIEQHRKHARLSIKLWQGTLPHEKHRPPEDTQVTYHGSGTIQGSIQKKKNLFSLPSVIETA